MHGQATPCIALGNYRNQRLWGSCFAYLQWMLSTWKHLEHILGLPGTAGFVGWGRQKHKGLCVEVFLDVPPQQAAAGKSILSASLLMSTATSMCVRITPGLSMPTALWETASLRGLSRWQLISLLKGGVPKEICSNLNSTVPSVLPCMSNGTTKPMHDLVFYLPVSSLASPIPSFFYKMFIF